MKRADSIDVAAIREGWPRKGWHRVSQRSFAQALGVSVKTVRNWEQRRRRPTGPALVLLTLVQRDPLFVAYILESNPKTPMA
jgi:putative transcriptional regulator